MGKTGVPEEKPLGTKTRTTTQIQPTWPICTLVYFCLLNLLGSRDGAVVRALTSHQCGLGSFPGLNDICGLSLLLVLIFVPRGFSSGTSVFPSLHKPAFPISNLLWRTTLSVLTKS